MKIFHSIGVLSALAITSCFSHNLAVPKPTHIEVVNQDSSLISEDKSKVENKAGNESKGKYDRQKQSFVAVIKSDNQSKINELWNQIQKITDESERKSQKEQFISLIASHHQDKLNNFFSKPNPTKDEINFAIKGAAEVGNQELTDQLLSKGGNISTAVEWVVAGNNVDLVIDRWARFNSAISGSLWHKHIAKKLNQSTSKDAELLNKLLSNKDETKYIDLSVVAIEATCLSDKETIDILFDQGVDLKPAIFANTICGQQDLNSELLLKEKDKNFAVKHVAQFEIEVMWKLLGQGASKKEAIRGVKSRKNPDENLIKKIQEFRVYQIENKE